MAPENTRPAFEFARKHSADILELDVRLSRDRELMVIHDDTVDRTTNGTGKVADMSASAISALDAGYRFYFEGEQKTAFRGSGVVIDRLQELLSLYPDMHFNIDIKDNSALAVDALAKTLAQSSVQGRVVVASFHHRVLQYCRHSFPWIKTSASKVDVRQFYWSYLRGRHSVAALPTSLFQLPLRYFAISFTSPQFIDAVHEAGITIDYWTVNKPEIIAQLIEKGADGIVTDRPDIASAIVKQ